MSETLKYWRIGNKVPLNVYDGDGRPICQCHRGEEAELIVAAVNARIAAEYDSIVKQKP